MSKLLIVIIIGIIAIGGYFLWGRGAQAPAPIEPQAFEQSQETVSPVIFYTDNGYTPSAITIKAGEEVTFKNDSSKTMWPASAMHPTHVAYPTTGGCLGSTFDACKGIQPGYSWSFMFDIPGTWKYHDHLSPAFLGAIIVE